MTEWNEDATKAEFETHVTSRTRQMLLRAYVASAIFLLTVLTIVPFLDGHSLHRYWENFGKYLLILAMAELLWLVMRWGSVYASWQSARETRRAMQ